MGGGGIQRGPMSKDSWDLPKAPKGPKGSPSVGPLNGVPVRLA